MGCLKVQMRTQQRRLFLLKGEGAHLRLNCKCLIIVRNERADEDLFALQALIRWSGIELDVKLLTDVPVKILGEP